MFTFFSVKRQCAVFLACFLSAAFIKDAAAVAINLDKPHIDVVSPAGQAATGAIKVMNKGEEPIVVQTAIEDWVYGSGGNRIFKEPGTTPLSCANWIELVPSKVVLNPGEEKEVVYTIKVPEDSTGGHYAAIFFSGSPVSLEKADFENMSVTVVGRIGTIVYHETEGKVNKTALITSFDVAKPEENKPLIVNYKIRNAGNAYIKFKGTLNIIDDKGTVLGKAESAISPGSLPGDECEDSVKWFGSLQKGRYDLVLTIDMGEGIPPIVKEEPIVIERNIK